MTTNAEPAVSQPVTMQPSTAIAPAKNSILDSLMDQVLGTINKADEKAAAQRVAALRARYPNDTPDQLAERLIRQRCRQAGAIGAVTSSASIIPGVGTAATLVFGVAADLRLTYQLQSEMVLELAAIYNRPVGLEDKRYIVALVTGLSAGTNQLVAKAGAELAERASARLAQKAVTKSIPFLGVAASGGINMVATYLIARRAQAYFRQDPTALLEWNDHMRALTGVDERKLTSWLAGTTEQTWRRGSRQMQNMAGAVVLAGQSAGKLMVTAAGQTGDAAGAAWGRIRNWRKRKGEEPQAIPIQIEPVDTPPAS